MRTTPAEIRAIEAIRVNHLKANINDRCVRGQHWDRAWLDPGGTIFGPGPYVKLPVDWLVRKGSDETEEVTIRVYPPARLRVKLAKLLALASSSPTTGVVK